MLNRALAIVAALAVAGALGIGWWGASTYAENKRLGEAVASLQSDLAASQKLRQKDQAVASRYAKSVAKLTTANKVSDERLRIALEANASWADSPVPPDVADALGMPSPTPAR